MSIVSKITAYGTPGLVAAGAVGIWGQSLLQWVTQPSHLLPVAAVTAVSALGIASKKGKVKPEPQPQPELPSQESVDERILRLTEKLAQQPQSLPKPATVINYEQASQPVVRRTV